VGGRRNFDETQVVQNCTVLCCVWFWGIFEMLSGEVFYSLREVQIIIETGSKHHNTKRTQSALGCRQPAPESIKTIDQKPTMP